MSDRAYSEKPEKQEEKLEKQDEKEEKGREEKWRRDPLGAIIWALILIWAGLVFLAQNLGWLARFELQSVWGLILIGAGVLVLVEVLIRLVWPECRRPVVGSFIVGIILVGIGIGLTFQAPAQMWGVIIAVAIIAVGVSILVRGLARRQ